MVHFALTELLAGRIPDLSSRTRFGVLDPVDPARYMDFIGEAVIRCYDPCLSCSTHAIGNMPLQIQLLNKRGEVIDELRRA